MVRMMAAELLQGPAVPLELIYLQSHGWRLTTGRRCESGMRKRSTDRHGSRWRRQASTEPAAAKADLNRLPHPLTTGARAEQVRKRVTAALSNSTPWPPSTGGWFSFRTARAGDSARAVITSSSARRPPSDARNNTPVVRVQLNSRRRASRFGASVAHLP